MQVSPDGNVWGATINKTGSFIFRNTPIAASEAGSAWKRKAPAGSASFPST